MAVQLKVPSDFPLYSEEKHLYTLLQDMMEEVLVNRPKDPLQCLIDFMSRDESNVPKVIVYGAPVSGKKTIGRRLAQKLQCMYMDPISVLGVEDSQAAMQVKNALEANQVVSPSMWAEVLSMRLKQKDCLNKGWVLAGFPNTREEALLLQASGIMAHHFVHLEATDSVLLERSVGKRVDPITGDIYHVTFAVAPTPDVSSRVVPVEGGQDYVLHRLEEYRRHSEGVVSCYQYSYKLFDADQPLDDLFSQVMGFLSHVPRNNAPLVPRVVIMGPPGSGKSTIAAQLTKKYNLVNVDCSELLNRTLQSSSQLASHMLPFHEKGMLIPDDMVLKVIELRLNQLDCATKGWVLHGFPLNREQAELLSSAGLQPNRVYVLDIPLDSLLERVTLRYVDPVTGKRYHLFYNPPPSQEIKDRLKQNPKDSEKSLRRKVGQYEAFLEDLLAYYATGHHVNADQDPQTVFECVETGLVNPLPKQVM